MNACRKADVHTKSESKILQATGSASKASSGAFTILLKMKSLEGEEDSHPHRSGVTGATSTVRYGAR